MAVAQTVAKFGYNNTYAGSIAASFASTPTPGNMIVFVGYGNGGGVAIGPSVADNQGNGAYTVVQGPEMSSNSRCFIAYQTATTSSGTFTVTVSTTGAPRSMEGVLLEIPAADVSGGLDQSVIGGIASGAYALSTPVANATASAFCVSALVLQAGGNAASPALTTAPSGYTNILDSNAAGTCEVTAAYRYAGAAAVETVTYPDYFSGDYNQSGVLLTFKTSGGSPTSYYLSDTVEM